MTTERPFLSTGIRLDGVADVLMALALSASWLGLLGRWHWALDLLSHFRWQYLAAAVVAVGWTLWRRRRWVLVLSLATVALNAALIGRLMGGGGEEGPGPRLRVVSLNVLTANPDKQAVLEYLRAAEADVLFLMEVDAEWGRVLEALKAAYPHGITHSRQDNFGVALLSRVPLAEAKLVELGASFVPSVEARLMFEGRELILLGTHPLPPMGPRLAAERDAQLRQVAEHVAGLGAPVLMVGDLNVSPWSEGMRLVTESGLKLAPRSWQPTWRAGGPLAIPIDHALCSAPLVIGGKRVGPDVGSDHRPIEVDLYWR